MDEIASCIIFVLLIFFIFYQVRYVYGNTNTAHALRRARTEMFTAPAGDRPGMIWIPYS